MTKTFPKSTLRRIIKAYEPDHKLAKNADVLVYLDYVLFMKELMKEADIVAREMGDSKIRGVHLSRKNIEEVPWLKRMISLLGIKTRLLVDKEFGKVAVLIEVK